MLIDFDVYITVIVLILIALLLFNIYFLSKNVYRYIKSKERFKFKLRYLRHYIVLINIAGILLVAGISVLIYTQPNPQIIRSTPVTEGTWEDYSKPIEIVFNLPVDRNRLNPNMNPLIKGRWEWEPYLGIERFTRVGKFYPEETLFPNERIVIYITGIARVGYRNEGHEGGIVLDSVAMPEVKATRPFNKKENVDINEEILVLLTKPIDNLADLNFKIEPKIDFDIKNETPTLIRLTPKTKLSQSTQYILTVQRAPKRVDLITNKELERDNFLDIHKISFTTIKEPFIKSITPKGNSVKADSSIRIRFETEMDKEIAESKISISPEVKGQFEWLDDRTLSLKPTEPLKKATKYTINIGSGLKSALGGSSERSLTHEFETVGKVKIASHSPSNGEIKVNINSNISITFDQEVDHASAQEKFSISPNVNGTFRWEGNTLTFDPDGFGFATTYTVKFAPGIKSVYGLENDAELSFSFTTRSNEIIISVPWYAQVQNPVSFTCNITSAKMVLAWKGFSTYEAGLISELGYNAGWDNVNQRYMGNPYKEFVGSADGFWGYGVYWTALQRLFNNRGIATEIKSNWNIYDLARSIENGKPVIIWRYNGTSTNADLDWVASDGTYVDGIRGQHGGVVTGFRGTVDNPTQFYINDPWFGLIWMDAGTFDYYWSRLHRHGLIIY